MKALSDTMAFTIHNGAYCSLSLSLRQPHSAHKEGARVRVRGFNYPTRSWQGINPQNYPASTFGLRFTD